MLARAEGEGNLDCPELAFSGRDDVEQDLEALGRELWRELLDLSRRIMKKPLMGSAMATPSTRLAIEVAKALKPARWLSKLSALPPST